MSSEKPVAPSPVAVSNNKKPKHHPAFGLMKGVISVAPGVDLTEPACPEWAELIEQKYGKDA